MEPCSIGGRIVVRVGRKISGLTAATGDKVADTTVVVALGRRPTRKPPGMDVDWLPAALS